MNIAFLKIKVELTAPTVLSFHNLEQWFIVEYDSSSVAVGTFLYQKKDDGRVHPI